MTEYHLALMSNGVEEINFIEELVCQMTFQPLRAAYVEHFLRIIFDPTTSVSNNSNSDQKDATLNVTAQVLWILTFCKWIY